jgi:hypothetical protein
MMPSPYAGPKRALRKRKRAPCDSVRYLKALMAEADAKGFLPASPARWKDLNKT